MNLGNIFRRRQIILLYHRVARVEPESDPWSLCVSPEHFAEHLEVLRKCAPITLQQVSPTRRSFGTSGIHVAVTFDDGYVDNCQQARRLLEQYAVPATFFVVTGYIGGAREFWWDELQRIIFRPAALPAAPPEDWPIRWPQAEPSSPRSSLYFALYQSFQSLSQEKRRDLFDRLAEWSREPLATRESHRPMTCDELSALAGSDLFEIGAHTVTHPKLSSQPVPIQQAEIRRSKAWLEELLGQPITAFSYPYGGRQHYSEKTVLAVKEAGFTRACTSFARQIGRGDTLHELPRFAITDMNGEEFERLLFS